MDEDGSQLTPPGFHVIPLPYADDIRSLKLNPPPEGSSRYSYYLCSYILFPVETEQIGKAKKLVKALRIKFDSRNFENPGSLYMKKTEKANGLLYLICSVAKALRRTASSGLGAN